VGRVSVERTSYAKSFCLNRWISRCSFGTLAVMFWFTTALHTQAVGHTATRCTLGVCVRTGS